jgi:predicted transcriptional regulator
MTPAQCRAARALLDISQAELADWAVMPGALLADFEAGTVTLRPNDVKAIRDQLEGAGVEFIERGVRLRK